MGSDPLFFRYNQTAVMAMSNTSEYMMFFLRLSMLGLRICRARYVNSVHATMLRLINKTLYVDFRLTIADCRFALEVWACGLQSGVQSKIVNRKSTILNMFRY